MIHSATSLNRKGWFINAFLSNDDILQFQKGGLLSDPIFPLTPDTVNHYWKLKNYCISFELITFRFLIFGLSIFLFNFLLSLIGWVFFIYKKKRKAFIKIAIIAIHIFLIISFLISIVSSLFFFRLLESKFPPFSQYTTSICQELNNIMRQISESASQMTTHLPTILETLPQFDDFFQKTQATMKQFGFTTNYSVFFYVEYLLKQYYRLSNSLAQEVANRNLQKVYDDYIDSILPDQVKCTGECYQWLKDYNRKDLTIEQIDKITTCVGRDGVTYDDCLDLFKNGAQSFISYFDTPFNLSKTLSIELEDWTDIILPKLDSFLEFHFLTFSNALQTNFTNFLNDIHSCYSQSMILPIIFAVFMGLTCIYYIICIFIKTRRNQLSFLLIVNSILFACFILFSSRPFIYSSFLQESVLHFNRFFNTTKPIPDGFSIFYDLFQCKTGTIGTSMQFGRITSGRELLINSILESMVVEVIPTVLDHGRNITYPLTYFAFLDTSTSKTLLPYYEIGNEKFHEIIQNSIDTDPLFLAFSQLYRSQLGSLETELVNLHKTYNQNFEISYDDVFGEGNACEDLSLLQLDECENRLNGQNNEDIDFLKQNNFVILFKDHSEQIQKALEEFSKFGSIYKAEQKVIDTVITLVKYDLYQISNQLANVYIESSKFIKAYHDFVYRGDGLQKFYTYSQGIVNASCTKVSSIYNDFQDLVLYTISEYEYKLFSVLMASSFLCVMIAISFVLFKFIIGGDFKKNKSEKISKDTNEINNSESKNQSDSTSLSNIHHIELNQHNCFDSTDQTPASKNENVMDSTSDDETFGEEGIGFGKTEKAAVYSISDDNNNFYHPERSTIISPPVFYQNNPDDQPLQPLPTLLPIGSNLAMLDPLSSEDETE